MSTILFTPTATATATATATLSSSPLHRSCKLSGKRRVIRSRTLGILSCKLQQEKEDQGKEHGMIIDRRKVLIGLGSLCGASVVVDKGSIAKAASSRVQTVPEFGSPLNKTIRAIVERPNKKKKDAEEVLVVYGVEIPNDDALRFDVYVDKPVYGDEGLIMDEPNDYGELAGSMVDLAHTRVGRKAPNGSLNLGISELIKDIEAEGSNNLVVTLVPRSGQVIIGGIRIENWDYDDE